MKRGSALLIVLGMLSFLVVSAVAFSAFMREARRPSSYLLRTSSSRLLVKAGLAEAMDALEKAIGDNAHPGIGGTDDSNRWIGRVFYGRAFGGETTVPTLTLEGLAYVPFPLINAARYHSRRTPTAAWHSFSFDSGRYAYAAIDVSDYFDVNRVMAAPGGGRTSAADGRITLAYLFETADHKDWRTPPTEWDDFMDNFLDDSSGGSKVPLVSVADLNLALNHEPPKGVRSPWCEFIEGKSSQFMPDGEEARVQSNMVFVTDSWYPSAKADNELDVANGENQPFYGLSIGDATDYRKRGVDEIAQMQNAFSRRFSSCLRLPEYVQLCDYLDVDSVPTSLALPTTERVPMVIGVSLAGANSLGLSATRADRQVSAKKDGEPSYEVTTYTLKLTGEINPVVAVAYPFKHQRGSDDNAVFRVQLAATVTLVPRDSVGKVRLQSARSPAVFTKDAWTENELKPTPAGYDGANDFKPVVAMCSAPVQLQLKRRPGSASECLLEMPIQGFQFNGIAFSSKMEKSQYDPTGNEDDCTLRIVEKVDPDTGARTVVETTKGFLPSNTDLSGTFPDSRKPADIADDAEFAPVVQVWVRVLNSDGDTVDLMPACVADDARPSQLLGSLAKDLPAQAVRPVLRFADAGKSVSISRNSLEALSKTSVDVGRSPQAYVADDPRFNYAPEDLLAVSELSGKLGDTWLDKVTAPGAAKEEKDIFMETSDAGYLQSKYELAFLLDVTGFGSSMWGELERYKGGGTAKDAMWSAYTPYSSAESGDGYADFFRDKLKIASGAGAAFICPYTPDVTIMMGALANTPYDWWAASTNDFGKAKKTMLEDPKAALEYTFSEHASDPSARVKWNDLEDLAKTFINSFRAMGKDADGKSSWSGWDVKYDGFAWSGALFDNIEDNSNVTLDAVDRKFLYGYWRECFAVRQQLFLIFVRAEPMMMGGGSNIRPVMGARAVALVWRDPVKPANGGPHRMRVLFYRQLD